MATTSLFSPVIVAYQWVDKASNILNNKIGLDTAGVKQSYQELLTEMSQQKQKAGTLNTAIDNFIKTTHNY